MNSQVRIAHRSPDAPGVDAHVDGDPVLADVSFSTPGEHVTVDVRPAGADERVRSLSDVRVDGVTSYTAFAAGMLADDSVDVMLVVGYATADADDRAVAP